MLRVQGKFSNMNSNLRHHSSFYQQPRKTLKERRMEKSVLHRFETYLKAAVKKVEELAESRETEDEIVLVVATKEGIAVEMKTGEYSKSEAKRHVEFTLDYVTEHMNLQPISWNFKGENVLHSPKHPAPYTLREKVLDYFGLY